MTLPRALYWIWAHCFVACLFGASVSFYHERKCPNDPSHEIGDLAIAMLWEASVPAVLIAGAIYQPAAECERP
jgi:hypothetical protein